MVGREKEVEKIIKNAKEKMQEMLFSVYDYNVRFVKSREDKELLKKILFAMSVIDRRFFIEHEYAYLDNALPIGEGQTISQPSTVARMLMLAKLESGDEVLEIGAGSGWNASLISFLAYPGNVLSIDRINALVERAEINVSKLRNFLKQAMPHEIEKLKVNFSIKDFFKLGSKIKYDKVILTAGISGSEMEGKIKEMASKLLKKEGILICPLSSGPMLIFRNNKGIERSETLEEYVFVPLLKGVKRQEN